MPAAQLEQLVMPHYFDKNAIGPVRAVASRTQDVIGAIIDMAAAIHPTADLVRLAELLPVQLELGIPAEQSLKRLDGVGPPVSDDRVLHAVARGPSAAPWLRC